MKSYISVIKHKSLGGMSSRSLTLVYLHFFYGLQILFHFFQEVHQRAIRTDWVSFAVRIKQFHR